MKYDKFVIVKGQSIADIIVYRIWHVVNVRCKADVRDVTILVRKIILREDKLRNVLKQYKPRKIWLKLNVGE